MRANRVANQQGGLRLLFVSLCASSMWTPDARVQAQCPYFNASFRGTLPVPAAMYQDGGRHAGRSTMDVDERRRSHGQDSHLAPPRRALAAPAAPAAPTTPSLAYPTSFPWLQGAFESDLTYQVDASSAEHRGVAAHAHSHSHSPGGHGTPASLVWTHVPKTGQSFAYSVLSYACPSLDLKALDVKVGQFIKQQKQEGNSDPSVVLHIQKLLTSGPCSGKQSRSFGGSHTGGGKLRSADKCPGLAVGGSLSGHFPVPEKTQGKVVMMLREPKQRFMSGMFMIAGADVASKHSTRNTEWMDVQVAAAKLRFRGCYARVLTGEHCSLAHYMGQANIARTAEDMIRQARDAGHAQPQRACHLAGNPHRPGMKLGKSTVLMLKNTHGGIRPDMNHAAAVKCSGNRVASCLPAAFKAIDEKIYFIGLVELWNPSICLFHAKLGSQPKKEEFKNIHKGGVSSRHINSFTRPNGSYNVSWMGGWRDDCDEAIYRRVVQRFLAEWTAHQSRLPKTRECRVFEGVTAGDLAIQLKSYLQETYFVDTAQDAGSGY